MNPNVPNSHINVLAEKVILLLGLFVSAGRLLFTHAATGGSQLCLHCGLIQPPYGNGAQKTHKTPGNCKHAAQTTPVHTLPCLLQLRVDWKT